VDEFELGAPPCIELCDLLKVLGWCSSGGMAKALIADGEVRVDGEVELRKRCKIRNGQVVVLHDQQVTVRQ